MKIGLSACILAGGKSRRMGKAKPFLLIDGKRMLDIVIENMSGIFDEVTIVAGRRENFSHFRGKVIEDIFKNCGPLGGIHAGLMEISGEGAFFTACDMPFLDSAFVFRIIEEANLEKYDCIIPKHSQGIEPLCAIYSRRILPQIEVSLKERRFSLRDLIAKCNAKYVSAEEKLINSLKNVNTPSDLS